ncbi:Peptidyl-tRNA hydrolase [Candidatus Hepatincola sp. Pdp]
MLAIVGLGNIGNDYQNTKHNLGFMVIDYLHSFYKFPAFKLKFKALIAEHTIANNKVLLIKPQTYMNLSGDALVDIKNFYKLENSNFVVFQDDIDLPFLTTRYKTNSADGGQKGIKDIQNKIGKDIHRIKIGIGRPVNPKVDIAKYVLLKFNKEELLNIQVLCANIANNFNYLVNKDFQNLIINLNQ